MPVDSISRQEINLFKLFKAPPPITSIITWRRLILSYLCATLFFILLTLFTLGQSYYLNNEKDYLIRRSQQLKKLFYGLKKNYPSFFFTQDVTNLVEQLQKNIDSQQTLLQSIINKKPFSKDLILIAQTINAGTWLTGITI